MTTLTHEFEDMSGNTYCFLYSESTETVEVQKNRNTVSFESPAQFFREIEEFRSKVEAIQNN